MKYIFYKKLKYNINMKSPSKNKKIQLHSLFDELLFSQIIIKKSTKIEISID